MAWRLLAFEKVEQFEHGATKAFSVLRVGQARVVSAGLFAELATRTVFHDDSM